MSVTYDIVCVDCRASLWIGQSSYLYGAGPERSAQFKFLRGHAGHRLVCGTSQEIDDALVPEFGVLWEDHLAYYSSTEDGQCGSVDPVSGSVCALESDHATDGAASQLVPQHMDWSGFMWGEDSDHRDDMEGAA